MRFSPLAFAFVASLVLSARDARAQEPPFAPAPPAPAPAPDAPAAAPEAPPPSPERNRDDLRYRDANADRVVLGSTAETHPEGTFFFSDYELVLLQLGYAVTDDVQLSITGVPPIVRDQPYWFELGAKINVARTRWFRAALSGGFEVVTTGDSGSNSGPYFGGRLGGVGQVCFDVPCRSSLSLNAGTLITSGIDQAFPFYGSAGFIANVSPLVSLLAEPALIGIVGTGTNDVSSGAIFALDYGVRLSGKNFGVDSHVPRADRRDERALRQPLPPRLPVPRVHVPHRRRTPGLAERARRTALAESRARPCVRANLHEHLIRQLPYFATIALARSAKPFNWCRSNCSHVHKELVSKTRSTKSFPSR